MYVGGVMYRMSDSRRRLFFPMREARGLQCNIHVVTVDGYLPMLRNLTVGQAQGEKGCWGWVSSGILWMWMDALCIPSDMCIRYLQYISLPIIHPDISLSRILQIRTWIEHCSLHLTGTFNLIMPSRHSVIFLFFHLSISPRKIPRRALGAEQLISSRPRRSSSSFANRVAEVPEQPPPVIL